MGKLHKRRRKKPPRRLVKIYFWLKRQYELRNRLFIWNGFSSAEKNELVNTAVSLGRDGMEAYLNEKFGAIPFYTNFRGRKVLKKQPKAIKLSKRVKLVKGEKLPDQIIDEILGYEK